MKIQHIHDDKGGRFYMDEEDGGTTELLYRTQGPEKMIIDHTEVDEIHEGKGIGRQLVAEAINYARSRNMKVVPMCRFAKAIMERSDEYKDILAGYP